MILHIEGALRQFIDIQAFREAHNLPYSFGIATFEPKDYAGLASLDHAGDALAYVRDAVLAAIPDSLTLSELMDFIPALAAAFQRALYTVNDRVKLKDVEIEFAVSGFSDVLHRLLYARLEVETGTSLMTDFAAVYQGWLNDSARVSTTVHAYLHQAATWQVQVVNHAYGRVGLLIRTTDKTHYVRDGTLACPAEGYMTRLLAVVSQRSGLV